MGTTENYKLLGGDENGFLISTTNKLWQYDIRTGKAEELLNWQDGNVNIDGYNVEKIIVAEPDMTVLCYDYALDEYEIAEISYVDKAYVKERKTVVLGAAHSFAVKPWVKKFNRSNKDYVVVIKEYENITQFTDVLLYNREEIPDLLDISWSSAEMLNSKNLLVDLEPYFNESEVVGKEDLMEQVWEAGCYQGVLTSIMNGFSFQTCLTTADTISEDGWTYEDFFALEDACPESRPLQTYTEIGVWKFLQTAGVNDYADWESRTCSFTSPEFMELLTQLKELAYVTADQSRVEYETDTAQQFLSGEFLIQTGNYGSPYFIKSMLKEYNGKVKNVGYPTKDGSPCYLMNPQMQLGIYSQSENKDGAWAFIEYLLSEEMQDWYGAENNIFPVRKEAFETYLSRSYSRTRGDGEYDKYITKTKKIIQRMLKYAQPQKDGDAGKITEIIYEELQAYFADTRTAKETADIIQSRVQLYLDETF